MVTIHHTNTVRNPVKHPGKKYSSRHMFKIITTHMAVHRPPPAHPLPLHTQPAFSSSEKQSSQQKTKTIIFLTQLPTDQADENKSID